MTINPHLFCSFYLFSSYFQINLISSMNSTFCTNLSLFHHCECIYHHCALTFRHLYFSWMSENFLYFFVLIESNFPCSFIYCYLQHLDVTGALTKEIKHTSMLARGKFKIIAMPFPIVICNVLCHSVQWFAVLVTVPFALPLIMHVN